MSSNECQISGWENGILVITNNGKFYYMPKAKEKLVSVMATHYRVIFRDYSARKGVGHATLVASESPPHTWKLEIYTPEDYLIFHQGII